MYIQVDGIFLENKGDELMLRAIADHFDSFEIEKDVRLVFGNGKSRPDPLLLRQIGLLQLAMLQRFRFRWDKIFPDKYLYGYGLVNEKKIDVILDSGGFQFGDQWIDRFSEADIRKLSNYYEGYKKRGARVIFLPQAFGPFERNKSKKLIEMIYQFADLVFARDKKSFEYLTETLGTQEKIDMAPDFTNLLEPKKDMEKLEKYFGQVCIIPNAKMQTHTEKAVGDRYMDFMVDISNHIMNLGHQIIFLNHEGIDDETLIQNIMSRLKGECLFRPDLDALQIKAIIKQARLLISSRYHGVISGLSQGVPTFCTGWSHKYEMLMMEYGFPDRILNVMNLDDGAEKIKDTLNSSRSITPDQKEDAVQMNKNRSREMWEKVHDVIFN